MRKSQLSPMDIILIKTLKNALIKTLNYLHDKAEFNEILFNIHLFVLVS